MTKFCVVLVEPEHPHNVGFCARAMRAYGQTDLRVVRPIPLPKMAWETAHASAEILDQAKVVGSLSEAIADCGSAIAFSRRVFDLVLPHTSLPKLPEFYGIDRDLVALVFGRESKGLSHEEISQCHVQCEIPVAGNMSLNLAQAVSVGLYELCRAGLLTQRSGLAKRNRVRNPAQTVAQGHAELEAFVSFLTERLKVQTKGSPWSETAIRKWVHRLDPDSLELRALFGIVRSLAKEPARVGKAAKKS